GGGRRGGEGGEVGDVGEVRGGRDVCGITFAHLPEPPPAYCPTTTPSNVTDRGTTNPSVSPVMSRSLQRLRTLTRKFVMRVPLPTCPASRSSRFRCATGRSPKRR